jgi:hypothetical protein
MKRVTLIGAVLAVVLTFASSAAADPKDETQIRTMVCDNGLTVEAVIHRSNTTTLHVTTDTTNFVIKRTVRGGVVLFEVAGFEDKTLVTCETVGFDLTVTGFFTPRTP